MDTANEYMNGSSAQFVGEFIKDHRQSVVLSKYSNAMPGNDASAAGQNASFCKWHNSAEGVDRGRVWRRTSSRSYRGG